MYAGSEASLFFMFILFMSLERSSVYFLPKWRVIGCRLLGSDSIEFSKADRAAAVGDEEAAGTGVCLELFSDAEGASMRTRLGDPRRLFHRGIVVVVVVVVVVVRRWFSRSMLLSSATKGYCCCPLLVGLVENRLVL